MIFERSLISRICCDGSKQHPFAKKVSGPTLLQPYTALGIRLSLNAIEQI